LETPASYSGTGSQHQGHPTSLAGPSIFSRARGAAQARPNTQEDFISRAASAHPLPDLTEAVLAAGFDDAKVLERSWTDTLATPEEWWAIQWTHAVRFFLQALEPEALSALKSEALDRLERTDDGGVTVTSKVIYCVARC
ncbi:MAG: hypothetical protein ACYCSF_10095, partial [Acidimicrobiales bacterium]